ncbi:hypothetical protein TorRG33x02_101260, partial [Trema orientale]
MPLWVRAYGFLVKFMTDKNAAKVAACTGKVLEILLIFKKGILVNSYMKFRVEVNLNSPIQARFLLPRDRDSPLWTYFKYEHLPM